MDHIPTLADASFCESVEAGHSNKPLNARIAELMNITKPPVQMDSQAKYCSIARGDGHIYLRLPVQAEYEEKIWVSSTTTLFSSAHSPYDVYLQDHASGALLVEEAGGMVSDMNGSSLDFSRGRTLSGNKGIVAAPKKLHAQVLKCVQRALDEKEGGRL